MHGDARFILDTLCGDYLEIAKYLSIDSTIVHSLPIENVIIKVMDCKESQSTATERTSVKSLCIDEDRDDDEDNFPPCSYVEVIEAKRRRLTSAAPSFIDCKLIPQRLARSDDISLQLRS